MTDHAGFMSRAIALSRQALALEGTEPFGALVVKNGAIVGEGLNHSKAHLDPTSHGEVEAIRDACRTLQSTDLTGCDLYTSCEPCALCVAAMSIVNIRKLYYGASLDQSGPVLAGVDPAVRIGVDVAALRQEAGSPIDARRLPAEQLMPGEAVRVLEQWAAAKAGR